MQKFAPGLSELTKHIRDLIKEDVESVWEESVHGECFKAVKAVIASAHVLKFFDASDCAVFISYRPNQQKEPMISHENPTRPWEKVGCPFHLSLSIIAMSIMLQLFLFLVNDQ